MAEYNKEGSRDLAAFLATVGTRTPPDPGSGTLTLAAGTYYIPLGSDSAWAPGQTALDSVHVKWDNVFVGVITVETTNFPHKKTGTWVGPDDVADWDTTAGNWIREIPSSADVSTTSTDGTTGGATVSSLQVTVAGGAAGGCMYHLGNLGSRRVRIKLAVTTGGVVRVSHTGKLGG